jgi:hypothetical protein
MPLLMTDSKIKQPAQVAAATYGHYYLPHAWPALREPDILSPKNIHVMLLVACDVALHDQLSPLNHQQVASQTASINRYLHRVRITK